METETGSDVIHHVNVENESVGLGTNEKPKSSNCNLSLKYLECPPLESLPYILQSRFFIVLRIAEFQNTSNSSNDLFVSAKCANCIEKKPNQNRDKVINGRTISKTNFVRHLQKCHPEEYKFYIAHKNEFDESRQAKAKQSDSGKIR